MAMERDGKFMTYDVVNDRMKEMNVDDVTRLEEQAEALAMFRSLTKKLGDWAQEVCRGERTMASYRNLFYKIDQLRDDRT